MLEVALFEPEIPPNTGNIIRLCANTGFRLQLIEPLGFALDDKRLRRAGLDYAEFAAIELYPSLESYILQRQPKRVLSVSTRAHRLYTEVEFQVGDSLLFGPETRGLPQDWLDRQPAGQLLRLPMVPDSRSLNLSNAVAVVVYEAWRQLGFPQGA